MPSSHASIPLPNRSSRVSQHATGLPAFAAPVRWTLAVLSWLAFGVASYLAYYSVIGESVAGCVVGSANDCDIVLSSSWSMLFGIPIAVLGLASYSTLATLSLLLGWREPNANRWITTTFVALAIVVSVASFWFVGVQVFAIGHFCMFCLITDACGVLIGILAVAATIQSVLAYRKLPRTRTQQPGLMALRSATVPAAVREASSATPVALISEPPSLALALGVAAPMLLILLGGQLLFPSKTYQIDQTALNELIRMDGSAGGAPDAIGAREHTALRVPDPLEDGNTPQSDLVDADNIDKSGDNKPPSDETNAESAASSSAKLAAAAEPKAEPPAAEPQRERIVKVLGGKLTLNTYEHPMIGSPEAPHIVVEMVSYDCQHCRKLNSFVHKALERYGDQVAVVIMPIPLEKGCNKFVTGDTGSHVGACPTARRACGVARLNPRAFVRFHNFLMSGGDKPPTTEQIVPKANGLVDRDRLRDLIGSPEVKKQIESYVELFGQLHAKSRNPKTFGLPVQILGDKVLSGGVDKADDVYDAWEEHLGVKPK